MNSHPCRVLVIDDMVDVAKTLAAVVGGLGPTTQYLTDPRLAVDVARSFKPTLVLLDIGMPHINGFQLAPMLRNALAPSALRIVAVTAWGSARDRAHSKACGFDDHLVKPASVSALANVLERFC
jgi:CheY-like chemotaxis protein